MSTRRRKKERESPQIPPARETGAGSAAPRAPERSRAFRSIVVVGALAFVGAAAILLSLCVRAPKGTPPPGAGPSSPPSGQSSRSGSAPPFTYAPPENIQALSEEEDALAARVMKDYPDSPDASLFMGMVREAQGNLDEAVQWWEKCLSQDPNYASAYEKIGMAALRRGENEKAETLWRSALEKSPAMPGLRRNLGRLLLNEGRIDAGIPLLESETRLSPEDSQAYFQLGRAYLLKKGYEKARMFYEKAVELKPDSKSAHYGLARAYGALGMKEAAARALERFQALEEDDRDTEHQRRRVHDDLESMRRDVALTYTNAGEVYRVGRNLSEAERLWTIAGVLDPKNAQCRQKLARLYEGTKRIPEALAVLEQLTALDPSNPLPYFNMGNLYLLSGRHDAAETAYKRVIDLAPRRADGYRALVQLYLYTKADPARTLSLAQEAVKLRQDGPNCFQLGLAYSLSGDLPNALAALEKAMRLDPENPQYRMTYESLQKEATPR